MKGNIENVATNVHLPINEEEEWSGTNVDEFYGVIESTSTLVCEWECVNVNPLAWLLVYIIYTVCQSVAYVC